MPIYEVTGPDGRVLELEGDAPPSESDLDAAFMGADDFSRKTTSPVQQLVGPPVDSNLEVASLFKTKPAAYDGPSISAPDDSARAVMRRGVESFRRGISPIFGPTKMQALERGPMLEDGSLVNKEGFIPALSHPFVPIPRADSTDPTTVAILSGLSPGTPVTTSAALYNEAAGLAEVFESRFGLATAGVGGVGSKILNRIASLLFAGDMGLKIPEAASEAGRLAVEGTPQEAKQATIGLVGQVLMAGGLGGKGLTGSPGFPGERQRPMVTEPVKVDSGPVVRMTEPTPVAQQVTAAGKSVSENVRAAMNYARQNVLNVTLRLEEARNKPGQAGAEMQASVAGAMESGRGAPGVASAEMQAKAKAAIDAANEAIGRLPDVAEVELPAAQKVIGDLVSQVENIVRAMQGGASVAQPAPITKTEPISSSVVVEPKVATTEAGRGGQEMLSAKYARLKAGNKEGTLNPTEQAEWAELDKRQKASETLAPEPTATETPASASDLELVGAVDPQSGSLLKPGTKPVAETAALTEAGLSPARPAEFAPSRAFTTRNTIDQVNKERKARGLGPIERGDPFTNRQAFDEANRILDENPQAPDAILERLKQNPAPLEPTESAIMALHRADVSNGYYRALKKYNEAVQAGDMDRAAMEANNLDIHLEKISGIDELVSVGGAGTAAGRALQAIKIGIREDMSLDMMMMKATRAKGGKLSPEEQVAVGREHDAIQNQADKLEAMLKREKATETGRDVQGSIEGAVKVARERSTSDKSKGVVRDIDAEKADAIGHLKDTFFESGSLDGQARTVRKLMEILVEQEHITDRNAMIDRVHQILKEVDPTITREGTMDAMSNYGKSKRPSQEFPKITVRDINAQILSVRKLLDYFQEKHPSLTGTLRDPPSQIQRDLLKVVNEAKRAFHLEGPVDAAKATRSAIEAINTRLLNRIKDLKSEIVTRRRVVSERTPSPYNDETVRLREELKTVQEAHTEIFGVKELTPEQRLAIAEKSAERRIVELKRQLNSGEIFSNTKQALGMTSPKLEAAKAQLEELEATRYYARQSAQPGLEIDAKEANSRVASLDRQIEGIEKQIKNEAPFSKSKQARTPSEDARVLAREAKLKALKEERQFMRERMQPKLEPEQAFLLNYLLRLRQRAAEYAERPGDFQRPERVKRELPPEVVQAQVDVERAKTAFKKRVHDYEQANRDMMQKVWDGIQKSRGTYVNVRSTLDLSAPRQLVGAILGHVGRSLTNPKAGARLLARIPVSMYQALKSEASSAAHAQRLLNRPNSVSGADKMAGIEYTDLNADKFTKYEENAHSTLDQWAQLPFKGGTVGQKLKSAVATPIRMSNRAFIAALNDARAGLFDELLSTNFKDKPPTPEQLKIIGNLVNVVTGRGRITDAGRTSQIASELFWSPKLLTSRVQALTGQPLWTGKWKGSAEARKVVAKEYARMIAGGFLLWQTSRLFDEKDETDLRSSDFGKIVRGNTRIDPWGGHLQPFVLFSRASTGETRGLDGGLRENELGDLLVNFGRGKLRPEWGSAWDLLDIRRDQVKPGHPKDYAELLKNSMGPLAWTETLQILKDRGMTEGMAIQALNVLGAGVSVYDDAEKSKPR